MKKPRTSVAVESIYLILTKSIYFTIHGYLKNNKLYLGLKIYLIKNKGHTLLI